MDGSLEPSLAAACCLGACEREQSEERKQGGKRRRKLREMEINKGEANKERGTASKKEICYAHKHGCGVVWCGVVWRERADQFCALHHPTASISWGSNKRRS